MVVPGKTKASVDCGSAEKIHGVCSKESVLLSLVSILCIFVRDWMQNRRSNWDTLDDIDLENRIIDINHSLTYYQRADDSYKCEFRVSLPKTEAGNRRIPMMQQVYDVLQEEYERQKQEGFCVENVDGMTNFVFTNRFGMPHNPAAVNRAIKRIVDTHNSEEEVAAKKEKREPVMIPRFSCHIFRTYVCIKILRE